jgi:hypothetical protein
MSPARPGDDIRARLFGALPWLWIFRLLPRRQRDLAPPAAIVLAMQA